MGNILDAVETVSSGLEKIGKKADVYASNGSIGTFLDSFIVTPRIVVSSTLKDSDAINGVIDLNLDVFVSMYTRTFNILMSVYGFDQTFALRTLGNGTKYSLESVEDNGEVSLDVCAEKGEFPLDVSKPALEDGNKVVREVELSADVTHPDTGKSASFKLTVLVKASIVYTDYVDIKEAIDTNGDKVSFGYRLDEYRSGAINLWNLITSNDLIKKYKKSRIRDKGDFLKYIEERRRKNIKRLSLSQTVDFSKMYQMIIISKKELSRAEKILGGSVKKDKFKDKLLDNTLSMSLTTIDDDYEMVDMMLEGIDDKVELSFKQIIKSGGNDTNEILKWMISQR